MAFYLNPDGTLPWQGALESDGGGPVRISFRDYVECCCGSSSGSSSSSSGSSSLSSGSYDFSGTEYQCPCCVSGKVSSKVVVAVGPANSIGEDHCYCQRCETYEGTYILDFLPIQEGESSPWPFCRWTGVVPVDATTCGEKWISTPGGSYWRINDRSAGYYRMTFFIYEDTTNEGYCWATCGMSFVTDPEGLGGTGQFADLMVPDGAEIHPTIPSRYTGLVDCESAVFRGINATMNYPPFWYLECDGYPAGWPGSYDKTSCFDIITPKPPQITVWM